MVLSNQRAASHGAEIQVYARELRIAILPLFFDNLIALGVQRRADTRNLPAWYQEFARFFFFLGIAAG